jgi:hypothetical protein
VAFIASPPRDVGLLCGIYARDQTTATITNTTWMFLAVLPWALISLEERRRDAGLRSVLAFLGATSSILSLLFLPLVIGWLAYRRTKAARIVGASFVVGLIVQMAVTLTSPPATGAKIDLPLLADATSVRVFGAFLLGTRWEADWWSANWVSLVVLGPLMAVALLLALGVGANRRAQVVAGSCTLLAVVFFAIPAWGRGTIYLGLGPSLIVNGYRDVWNEARFSVVPVMLLASAVAILIAPTMSRSLARRHVMQRLGIPAFALWFMIIMAVSFSQTTLIRGSDPSWTGRVDRVLTSDCLDRPGSTIVTVPNVLVGHAYPRVPNGYYALIVRCSNLK